MLEDEIQSCLVGRDIGDSREEAERNLKRSNSRIKLLCFERYIFLGFVDMECCNLPSTLEKQLDTPPGPLNT